MRYINLKHFKAAIQFFMTVFLVISTLALPAQALNVPKSSAYDPRVRHISYNPNDVVQIEAVVGIATHIVVEENEQYITHAFGDALSWSFANELNHYFIKPIANDANTNLTIITNKRTYYFRLHYHESRDSLAMYGVKFHYPDSDLKKYQENKIDKSFSKKIGQARYAGYNLSYSMSGDIDIAPINAWDNGEFTYFKFAGNSDIPGIYMVDIDGKESIVNRHTIGDANDIIVVHKINAKWVLRLGNRALSVYNDAYDATSVYNTSGTATYRIKRIIQGGSK